MLSSFLFLYLQSDEGSSQVRVRVIAGNSLAKKDIFGASDPYVRIDLNTINNDVNIDSVLTKTKKKVNNCEQNTNLIFFFSINNVSISFFLFDCRLSIHSGMKNLYFVWSRTNISLCFKCLTKIDLHAMTF
jgi:hypothetical protein